MFEVLRFYLPDFGAYTIHLWPLASGCLLLVLVTHLLCLLDKDGLTLTPPLTRCARLIGEENKRKSRKRITLPRGIPSDAKEIRCDIHVC